MVGKPSPQNPSISQLTLLPETITSCSRRISQAEFQPHSGRHPQQQDKDWEVTVTWAGRNWIERPNAKWLPLLLRKRAWPAMVGVAIVAQYDGPSEVFIGIGGPTQEDVEG
jgi:hypothetical protein